MSLTWHIVKKDLRRMAVPVAIWCGLVALITIAMRTVPMTLGLASSSGPDAPADVAAASWISSLETFIGLAIGIQTSTAVILAAFLVQQDPLVGSRAFWQTRPISDRRLFTAKLIAGALLFVIAPSIVLAVIGWSFGFSFSEGLSISGQFMLWQAIAVSVGFGIGALTSNLGTFLFVTLLGGAVFPVMLVVLNSGSGHTAGQAFTVKWLIMTGPALIYVAQSVGRKRRAGWWAFGAILAIAVLTGFGTPRIIDRVAIHLNGLNRPGAPETAADRQLVVRFAPDDAGEEHTLRASVERAAANEQVPALLSAALHFPNRVGDSWWEPGPRWGDVAAQRLLGVDRNLTPATWQLVQQPGRQSSGDLTHFQSASVEIAWTTPVLLWETAIRPGVTVAAGASSTHIVAVQPDGKDIEIILRESDARTLWRSWPNLGSVSDRRGNVRDHDCFLLHDPAHGTAEVLSRNDLRAVSLNGMMVTARSVRVTLPASDSDPMAWLQGKTLAKVRFTGDRVFMTKITAAASTARTDEIPSLAP